MMKRIINILYIMAASLLAFSCQKGDGDVDYGNTFIYMPQAMTTAGLDNYYQVPSSVLENTRNFIVSDTSVDIILGVLRSGKQSGSRFSVDIVVDREASAVAAAALGADVMSEGMYSLPEKANVEAGDNSAVFYLSIPKSELSNCLGKKLVLVVGIANPTLYELSSKGTSTCVVVDVDKLISVL